jgi:membrane-associated HD superfamily phosphohydrolase
MVRVNLGNFVLALVVSIGLVFLFSILPDGDPSEAASILIQAFWLILVVIRVILTIIFALIGMFFFVLLSFIVSALNFFIVDLGGGKAIDTTFLLDIQENALTAVDGFYYGFIDFLVVQKVAFYLSLQCFQILQVFGILIFKNF